ncbi:hypothetical protein CALVIDRAFT_566499 [Calocera viscosa TUFC12733]|uniref:Uncharacterized protein n=1 Tax=Calocera viscosa (strain TUFC12733) TaxID=1330018 RepID=A0A167JE92_CALVF|nr:hypothetical protein CALVIDRAFT_566499 [Calocera viscosa TUFC12733]
MSLSSAATKVLSAGAGAALTYTSLTVLAHERTWLTHPVLDKLPSLGQVAEAAAGAFAQSARSRWGPRENAKAGTGEKEKETMTFEEEVEYFLKPDMTGWRF